LVGDFDLERSLEIVNELTVFFPLGGKRGVAGVKKRRLFFRLKPLSGKPLIAFSVKSVSR
jgi:hypothetical protein